jgi:hypothetical protein
MYRGLAPVRAASSPASAGPAASAWYRAQPVTDHHVARGDGRSQVGGEPAQELFQLADVDGHHDLL